MHATASTTYRIAVLAGLLATCVLPARAAPRSYPPLGLYGSILGSGYPYLKADGSLDTLEIGRAARFSEVTLDVNPIVPYRPDIAQAFRARNPSITLLGYVLAEDIWNVNDPDSLRQIPTVIRRTVRDLGGFLYDKNTGQEYAGLNINIAKKGTNGHFVVAEAMAGIFRDHVIATGVFDGIFTDIFCHTAAWSQGGTNKLIDFQRAGYASLAELDVGWSAACDTFASHLRRDGGPNFILVGNCGPSAEHAYDNGWMRENFPFQQGGTWASNMLGDVSSRGYFKDDADFRQPPHNWIFSAGNTGAGQEYQMFNTSAARFGLASAALGEGVHTIGASSRRVQDAPYQDWWYDEYAVDLATGQSSQALQHTGWLGSPLGPAFTQLWPNPAPDVITNTGFEIDVTSGWSYRAFPPAVATLTRDATTAGLGSASAHIQITTPYTIDWYVSITSLGRLTMSAGSSYSATFRCKASAPRRVHVVAGNSGGQAYVTVDTTWRQYQAVLVPSTSMQTTLSFYVGTEVGDVWFDDVHFQTGVSSVWRRDFQNGIVLLNPTEYTLDVPLENPFRRIQGVHTTSINNGALSSSQSLGGRDALFLLRGQIDRTRPAAVGDLHVGP